MKKKVEVIYEDNHLIAINKLSGQLVQGDKTGDAPLSDLVKEFLIRKYQKTGEAYLGVPHRIDRPTSGLVLFSKTSKALPRLNKLFQERAVKKTYWAVVKQKPAHSEGQLVHYLIRDQKKNKSFAHLKEINGSKKAELHYRVIGELDHYFWLEIKPITGRHHQIRAQLAAINCPIKGDLKYGADRPNKDGGIHLHARTLELIHPVSGEKLKISAPAPKDPVWKACMKIKSVS